MNYFVWLNQQKQNKQKVYIKILVIVMKDKQTKITQNLEASH